jgi:glycosyltransferase involved in cell wall biosynthesis
MRVFWTSLRATALEAISSHRPDVVVVDHDMAAAWAWDLPEDLPAVLVCQNLTWNYYRSRARLAKGVFAVAFEAEARRYRRHVVGQLRRYHTAIAVSTRERDELIDIGRTSVRLIPSGVDTAALRAGPERPGPPRLLFTGSMSYRPNSDGIAWFVQHVWPEVKQRVSGIELDIVGRGPPPSVQHLGRLEGITVTGEVSDVAPYFARATVVVVPILTGAGIRIKILEALAAGRAIVSTSLGAEGLELEAGRHLLIADGKRAFSDATVAMLQDADLRQRLAREGRALAERRYDWRRLGDQQEALLRDVSAPKA